MEKMNNISSYKKASNGGGALSRRHSLSSAARPFPDHISGVSAAVHPPLMNFAGLLQAPFPPPHNNFAPFHSYPPYAMRHQNQPPLLPLPVSPPVKHHAGITRGASLPPARKTQIKQNGFRSTRDSASLTPKKSITKGSASSEVSNNGFRDVQKKVVIHEFSLLSESGMFAAISAPPPSSLPLPTFSLRPKRSCTAQAGGVVVDAGATDNLCRLLRLQ